MVMFHLYRNLLKDILLETDLPNHTCQPWHFPNLNQLVLIPVRRLFKFLKTLLLFVMTKASYTHPPA